MNRERSKDLFTAVFSLDVQIFLFQTTCHSIAKSLRFCLRLYIHFHVSSHAQPLKIHTHMACKKHY